MKGALTRPSNLRYLDTNPETPWQDLRYIFGEIMYGGHITDDFDRRTSSTYLSVYIIPELFGLPPAEDAPEGAPMKTLELAPGFAVPPNPEELDYDGYLDYIETKMPVESPTLLGLHPNAEIGFLVTNAENLFITIMQLSGGGGDGGGGSGGVVKAVMDDLAERLPPPFIMLLVMEIAGPKQGMDNPHSPFVTCAVQETGYMNNLLGEMRRTLVELDKGMKGQLNMTQPMEDMIVAFSINQWPGRNPFSKCTWEKNAWPSMKPLNAQFVDLLQRVEQLVSWLADCETPYSLWISGLFNPMSFLTAVKQVMARATKQPLDCTTNETYMTTYQTASDVPEVYPEDGFYVHGMFMEGARWTTPEEAAEDGPPRIVGVTPTAGWLMVSKLKELLPPLPVMYVKAIVVQPQWLPWVGGYTRFDDSFFECPVYVNQKRGGTYVFLSTMTTKDPIHKWVMTGTAIMMQTSGLS